MEARGRGKGKAFIIVFFFFFSFARPPLLHSTFSPLPPTFFLSLSTPLLFPLKTSQASCSRLQDLLDASPAPPRRHPSLRVPLGGANSLPPPPPPSAAAVAAVAGPLARRLGFTSRAPPFGWVPGQPLPPGGSRPPAPQEWQMRASGLRRLCGKEWWCSGWKKSFLLFFVSLCFSFPFEGKKNSVSFASLSHTKKQKKQRSASSPTRRRGLPQRRQQQRRKK